MATTDRKLPEADTLKVCRVCNLFLDYSEKHHAPDTFRGYSDFLNDFCQVYGTLLARDLKPLHVTRWLDSHKGWEGCRRNAVVAVKRAFNCADAEGLLQPNPIKAVKKPPQRHRDRVRTPEERQEILATIRDQPAGIADPHDDLADAAASEQTAKVAAAVLLLATPEEMVLIQGVIFRGETPEKVGLTIGASRTTVPRRLERFYKRVSGAATIGAIGVTDGRLTP